MVRRPAFATREEIRIAAAGTDPALVIRHFGTKEVLFLETMRLSFDDERLRGVPLEALGERLVEVLLDADADTRAVWLALLQASGEPAIAARLRESHEASFVAPLRERLSGPDADGRARVAGALLAGLLYSLWVIDDGKLPAGDRQGLVERYGGLLRGVLTAE